MKRLFFIVLISLLSIAAVWSALNLQQKSAEIITPPFEGKNKAWVDSVMKKLTPEQRIGQLFMVAAYSNKPKEHHDEIARLIKETGRLSSTPVFLVGIYCGSEKFGIPIIV